MHSWMPSPPPGHAQATWCPLTHTGSGLVMLSSSDGIFDIAKGQARGATAHVTKIPPERVLRQLIHKHTSKRKAA